LRKFIDAMAVTGFLLSASLTTAVGVTYVKLPEIIEKAKAELLETVTGMIPSVGMDALPTDKIKTPKLPF